MKILALMLVVSMQSAPSPGAKSTGYIGKLENATEMVLTVFSQVTSFGVSMWKTMSVDEGKDILAEVRTRAITLSSKNEKLRLDLQNSIDTGTQKDFPIDDRIKELTTELSKIEARLESFAPEIDYTHA